MTKIKYGNPPHLVCFICDDDGLCRNNIFSPYYDERLFGDTDYLDCIVYLRNKEDRPTENWIHGWLKFNKKKRIELLRLLNLLERVWYKKKETK